MAYIVDRRLNSKNKSAVNRQRFIKRYRKHIKKAVSEAITQRSITDVSGGEDISIPREDVSEPGFQHGPGGKRTIIHPGNKDFAKGDKIPRPPGGGGGSGGGEGDASDSGEGVDEFVFEITQEEFLEFMFDELELPNLVKRKLAGSDSFKYVKAGYVNEGSPNKINILRSMRTASARRIATGAGAKSKLKQLLSEREALMAVELEARDNQVIKHLDEQIEKLQSRIKRIPFLDTFDLRYNLHIKHPMPTVQAVMFCVMDVSGSMNQSMKDLAKRFFVLLYLFLERNYKKIDVVFIRHHTNAKEVEEEEFFYSRETGGTIVSSALKLMLEIMDDRYPEDDWNIYCAQASDGDNWSDDSPICREMLTNDVLPRVQYYSYIEVKPGSQQALWGDYEQVQIDNPDTFAMRRISDVSEIYPVFRDLFQRKSE